MSPEAQVFEVFTLFPEAVQAFVGAGLLGRALERGLVRVHCTNYRDFTTDKHRTVDDTPFGGGAGMILKPEPVVAALEAVGAERGPMHKILLTPSAPRFDQTAAERLAALPRIALVCGRYEGIDDRVREHFVDECLSIGDFVLGGGELAALVVIEVVSRLARGVLGNPDSVVAESFSRGGWLEYPQYTRPSEFRGHAVPPVLLRGNHAEIERFRADAARRRTWALRPDLRPVRSWPAGLELHLAFTAEAEPDPALLDVARRHGVAGLGLLGATAADVTAWARAFGGRLPVAAFASLNVMRKRLRQRGLAEPWVVGFVDANEAPAHAVRGPGELLDALLGAGEASPRPLVLFHGSGGHGLDDTQLAAVYALSQGLATAPAIADASPPLSGLTHVVERILLELLLPTAVNAA